MSKRYAHRPRSEVVEILATWRRQPFMVMTTLEPTFEDSLLQYMDSCCHAGVHSLELLDRGPPEDAKKRLECFKRVKRYRDINHPELFLGVGTLKLPERTREFLRVGIDFGVSPHRRPAIVAACRRAHTMFVGGVSTPNELAAAEEDGAEVVKYFPAVSPDMVKHFLVGRIYPETLVFATGGVSSKNLADYLPLVGAGIGTEFDGALRAASFQDIEAQLLQCIETLRRYHP